MLFANSRTPLERAGDLDAQIGANVLGAARLAGLASAPLDEVLDYGERRMRAALAALPDGRWTFTDVMDSFGPRPDQQAPSIIAVEVTVAGDEITFDFAGTAPQRAGSINAVEAVTVSSVAYAVRAATDPTLPANGGVLRPVHVLAPVGSLVNAVAPAAVGAGNVEVSQRVADVCLGALAQVVPGRVGAASQGTMNNIVVGNDRWVYYETLAGGQGGRPYRRGMSGVHTQMTNTRNTPVEALERAYPLRVRRLRLRRGSGGAGTHPGGEGVERDLEVLEAATLSLITERRQSSPWGLDGGGPGSVGENWLLPGGAKPMRGGSPTRSRSSSTPATWSGCSHRGAAVGGHLPEHLCPFRRPASRLPRLPRHGTERNLRDRDRWRLGHRRGGRPAAGRPRRQGRHRRPPGRQGQRARHRDRRGLRPRRRDQRRRRDRGGRAGQGDGSVARRWSTRPASAGPPARSARTGATTRPTTSAPSAR